MVCVITFNEVAENDIYYLKNVESILGEIGISVFGESEDSDSYSWSIDLSENETIDVDLIDEDDTPDVIQANEHIKEILEQSRENILNRNYNEELPDHIFNKNKYEEYVSEIEELKQGVVPLDLEYMEQYDPDRANKIKDLVTKLEIENRKLLDEMTNDLNKQLATDELALIFNSATGETIDPNILDEFLTEYEDLMEELEGISEEDLDHQIKIIEALLSFIKDDEIDEIVYKILNK